MTLAIQHRPNNIYLGVALLSFVLFFSSCSHEKLIKPGDSLQVAYSKSVALFQEGHYQDAIKAFQTVINYGRGTQYAKNSQYFEAQSYFKSGQYLLAANAYQQFLTLYPKAPQTQLATFKEALSYYKLSPRFDTEQSYTRKAIQKMNLYIAEYPESTRADKAGKYVEELRAKLAHKIYHAAEQYLLLDQYKAAVLYYEETVEQYPESPWAERALVKEIDAYNIYASKSVPASKRNRYKKAVATYQKYLQLFPDGKHLEKAKENFRVARDALKDLKPISSTKKVSSQN